MFRTTVDCRWHDKGYPPYSLEKEITEGRWIERFQLAN